MQSATRGMKDLDVAKELSRAADAFGDVDLVEEKIGGQQRWELMPTASMLLVRAGNHCRGGQARSFGFPTWLGKNSAQGKRNRLLGELAMHMNSNFSGSKEGLRLHYMPLLQRSVFGPLAGDKGAANIPAVIEFMDEYGLSREDVFESMTDFKFPGFPDPVAKIPSKTKAAFTRAYNKGTHKSQALAKTDAPVKAAKAAKPKGKGKAAAKKKK